LKRWLLPFAIGFGWPECVARAYFDVYASSGLGEVPLLHFVGCVYGEPVATSSLFLDVGVAGLYNVACVPEHRCRGYGTALTLAALREAHARGYAAAVLHSTEQGKGLYQRLGFSEYCRLGIYVLEAGRG
jgi:ribosomal protein S18 acetylase RimI-like enzyme